MKKFTYILLFLCALVCSQGLNAQTGTSCQNAIPLTKDYQEMVLNSGTTVKWYRANSFDLPLTVTFRPSDPNTPAPEAEMDFTCTPGQYEDPFLYELFSPENGSYIPMPFKPAMKTRTVNGNKEYYISMGDSYRDMLLQMGISYNVEVYVKVTFHGTGQVGLSPDAFGDCMEATWIKRGQTYHVEANDIETHYIEPYVQWQDDSIRYIWNGQSPLVIAVGTDCMFEPTDGSNPKVLDIVPVQPGDTFKLTNKDIRNTLEWDSVPGGVYFCKFYSASAGTVKVEHIPAPPPAGGAILLSYNKTTPVPANSVDTAVFAIPTTWEGGTLFTTPTRHMFKMYVGLTPTFTTAEAIAEYQFSPKDNGHEQRVLADELAELISWATDNYLYVRFECTATTTITPRHWEPSSCLDISTMIVSGVQMRVNKQGTYAFLLSDWSGADMSVSVSPSNTTIYVADTCHFTLSVKNEHVNNYSNTGSNRTFEAEDMSEWETDADGYVYVRFGGTANVTFTNGVQETDPECDAVAVDTTVVTYADSYRWNGKVYRVDGTYTYNGVTTLGCDSLVTLHLSFSAGPTGDTTAVECESFEWYGQTYTESGTATHVFQTEAGLDSIVTLHLTINQPTTSETTVSGCVSYTWNGQTYTESGDYTFNTTNAANCDSVATLHLTILPTYAVDTTAKACDSFTWHGTTYTESGEYTYEGKTAAGCDSIVTLTLTINQPTISETTISECVSYTWNGQTYTESGDYTFNTTNAADCDSVATLHLTINKSYSVETIATACGEYTWRGTTYTQSGEYPYYGKTAAGCDSIVTLKLTIYEAKQVEERDTVCGGMTGYTWNGKTYYQSGDYTWTGKTVHGCDSVVTLHLVVNESTEGTDRITTYEPSYIWLDGTAYTGSMKGPMYTMENAAGCDSLITLQLMMRHLNTDTTRMTVCQSELPVSWRGKTYTETGEYNTDTILDAQQTTWKNRYIYQDTVHVLSLVVNPTYAVDTTVMLCADSYTWPRSGQTYTASGNYPYSTQTVADCDSTVTLRLTLSHPYAVDTTATACDAFTWHGTTYTSSGDYTYEGQTIANCDSTVTLHLTIHPSTTSETTISECGSYTWNGQTYTASGDYTFSTTNAARCDSVATLHLTILPTYSVDTTAVLCANSFTWPLSGETYTASGDYTYNGQTAADCDSTVVLHLTLNQPTESEQTETACDSYTWNGQTYTASGDYTFNTTNAAGCDSTVVLHLTITHPTTADQTVTACDSYTWHGKAYTQSGDYTWQTTNVAGCDSTETLHLTIHKSSRGDETAVADDEYTWHGQTYTQSGDYTWQTTNAAGCDSTVTLHLTVNPCREMIVPIGDMLILNHDSVADFDRYSIQWWRDGAPMRGETGDRINVANQGGSYEAMLSACVGTNCDTVWTCPKYVDGEPPVIVVSKEGSITVYPSAVPVSDPYVMVKTNTKGYYYLYSVSGEMIQSVGYWDPDGILQIQLPAVRGLYILHFRPDEMVDMEQNVEQQVKLLVY